MVHSSIYKSLLTTILLLGSVNSIAQIKAPKIPQFETTVTKPGSTSVPYTSAPQAGAVRVSSTPPNPLMPVTGLLKELDNGKSALKNSQKKVDVNLTQDYYAALNVLDSMLSGKRKMSLADAFYTIEQAYGNAVVSYDEYTDIIKKSAQFIKQWMSENKLDVKDNYMQHYAIQKFMSEPLAVNNTATITDAANKVSTLTHSPFYYDYDDYGGEKDPKNMFVTKCLATGYGQCYSMPVVYMLLAEEMGIKSYLSMAPSHWFIKYPDNTGHIVNYEATSNWKLSDNWYADNLAILPEAIRSGIYMDTLNTEKIVANCAFDLATGYMRSAGPDTNFILDCLRVGVQHFPRSNNLQSLFVFQTYLRTMLADEMEKNGITRAEDIKKAPKAQYYYDELMKNVAHLKSLGYSDMPPERYKALTEEHEFKGRAQAKLPMNPKEKRNLFSIPE